MNKNLFFEKNNQKGGFNVKETFTLMPPADLIARANFSSLSLRNAHGRKNLLSFLAIRIRDIKLLFVPTYGGGMENNVKVPFTLLPPADLIARANFSSLSLRNAHGRKNLLSFLAIRIREI